MLNWLFGTKPGQAERCEDRMWMSHAARLKGIGREVAALAESGRSALVVAPTRAALEELLGALSSFEPLRCADGFSKDALRASLTRAGSVAVALAITLPAVGAKPLPGIKAGILAYGRGDTRAADDAILRFADVFGQDVTVTFHLSMEDPLIQDFGVRLKPLLVQLGASQDEPIVHAMVTRAIAKAQAKRAA